MLTPWIATTDPMWGDLDRIREELEQLFDLQPTAGNIRGVLRGTFPAVNVGETPDTIMAYIFCPGVDPAKIDLTLEKNVLTVSAERDTSKDFGGKEERHRFHRRERHTGGFRRIISLPESADPNKVDAKYTHGILVVSVGKKEEEKARKIEVAVS